MLARPWIAVFASSFLLFVLAAAPAVATPKIGQPAPAFSLRDREGTLVSLADLAYPGRAKGHRPKRVVVLDFFRTDCKPCRKALPKLVALHKTFKDKPVRVILVALLEEDEGQEKLDRFLEKQRLPFAVLVDTYAVAGKKYVAKGRGVQIPALFVIDRSGVLRARFSGLASKSKATIHKTISDLLK
jgi:peroxiredoxin